MDDSSQAKFEACVAAHSEGAGSATPAIPCDVPGVSLTQLGLIVTREELSPDEYNRLLHTSLVISRASNWVLGDTLNLASRTWGNKATGSKYEEAAAFTGLSPSTIRHIANTCRSIPYGRRHPDLSFTHHAEACAHTSDPDEQDAVLSMASEQKQNVSDMRKSMRSAGSARPKTTDELSAGAENDDRPFGLIDLPERAKPGAPPLWDALKLVDWVKKQSPEKYSLEQCEQAVELAAPVAAFYEAVRERMKVLGAI